MTSSGGGAALSVMDAAVSWGVCAGVGGWLDPPLEAAEALAEAGVGGVDLAAAEAGVGGAGFAAAAAGVGGDFAAGAAGGDGAAPLLAAVADVGVLASARQFALFRVRRVGTGHGPRPRPRPRAALARSARVRRPSRPSVHHRHRRRQRRVNARGGVPAGAGLAAAAAAAAAGVGGFAAPAAAAAPGLGMNDIPLVGVRPSGAGWPCLAFRWKTKQNKKATLGLRVVKPMGFDGGSRAGSGADRHAAFAWWGGETGSSAPGAWRGGSSSARAWKSAREGEPEVHPPLDAIRASLRTDFSCVKHVP